VRKERSAGNAHIVTAPWFEWPFRRISPMVLQQWVTALLKTNAMHAITRKGGLVERRKLGRKLSRKTVANVLQHLARCFDYAVVAGKVATNPARAVILPPATVREHADQLIVHLVPDEIDALFALELPAMQRAVFAVAIYSGLRKGELWGLQWRDVELDGPQPCLHIRRSYDGPCKTARAVRDVPLLPGTPIRDELREWKAAQKAAPHGSRLVFPADGGGCHNPSYTAGWRDHQGRPGWRSRARVRAGVSFSCMRHTFGCLVLQGAWTAKPMTLARLSKLMGHSSQAVTERHYAWITDKASLAAVFDVAADGE
jgi:integrase